MGRCRKCEIEVDETLIGGLCRECQAPAAETATPPRTAFAPLAVPGSTNTRPSGNLLKIGIVAAAVVAALAAGYWQLRSNQIASDYAAALADCRSGRGSAAIDALDRLYGDDARPKALRVDLSLCSLDQSVQDLERLNQLLQSQ